jgi:hypothetical protein
MHTVKPETGVGLKDQLPEDFANKKRKDNLEARVLLDAALSAGELPRDARLRRKRQVDFRRSIELASARYPSRFMPRYSMIKFAESDHRLRPAG